MMTSVLRREEGEAYSLQQFICSNKKETPPENKDLETDFKTFLEKGICMISRTGGTAYNINAHTNNTLDLEDSLSVKAGDEMRTLTLDNMLKRQEEAKRAAMTAANKNPRRR